MEEECKCPPPGLPAWMGTFADLMSLLMCFFVLLLSFSEMDVMKFRQIAGSMKFAFGVQNLLEVKDIPKGTSVIAQEFRPGRPEPTPIEVIMQQTIDMTQRSLTFQDGEEDRSGGTQRDSEGQKSGGATADLATQSEKLKDAEDSQSAAKSSSAAQMLMQALKKEIEEGAIDAENLGQQFVIRIKEKGMFPTGSAYLQRQFHPMIQKIGRIIKDVPGEIHISGHTDDTLVDTELYRSNLDLSAQRAVSVSLVMSEVEGFDPSRVRVEGAGSSRPLVPNDSDENREQNRRVEISIMQGKAMLSDEIATENMDPDS
ncbi:flagellar motor protein MotB [Veronia nyctiphanis]|uniref:Flagellar motor protein MotB n=1 Tax=Veronia nyctiphanis TaxID=1278244 RepID=A0A4Q0YQ33_9GAMM|nr:flagellar motor protein MotB [Veronia nyctiphanis]RXJ73106.1 flagellar motor protein MotB [Veronia nyctiphanis]